MADNPNFQIADPRPIAAESPYTFFSPHEKELAALRIGDLVQIIFEWEPPVVEYAAERMWVTIMHIDSDTFMGVLENEPFEAGRIHSGTSVTFHRYNVIGVEWSEPPPDIKVPVRREYWERCLVDDCILYEGAPVEYIYREEPDMGQEGDKFPDSGWRIRGPQTETTDEDPDKEKISYVALGTVLNKDDSWLSLIDSLVDSHFMRDVATGRYVEVE